MAGQIPMPEVRTRLGKERKVTPYTFPGIIEYLNIEDIPQLVGVDMSELDRRKGHLIIRRQIAIALMYIFSDKSGDQVGQVFGNKDHATVTYSIKRVDESIQINDKEFMHLILDPFKKLYHLHLHKKARYNDRKQLDAIRKIDERIEMSYFAQKLITQVA